jgi:hypothetical protein
MIGVLLTLVLLTQVQLGSGVVSGVLRDIAGNPVPNVRVALADVSEAANGARPGSVLVSLSTTDASGAYRLENIPPGRYFIVSGRIDTPTYYPGTPDSGSAKMISISSGLVVAGMDFVIAAESVQDAKPRVSDLPLVGRNVLDLINILGGGPHGSSQPLTFAFESVNGQIMNFKAADGSPLRYDCFGATVAQPPRDCTFHVSDRGIIDFFPQDVFGVSFRVKDSGRELEFTCKAAQCKVEISGSPPVDRTFRIRETGVLPTSSSAKFTVMR